MTFLQEFRYSAAENLIKIMLTALMHQVIDRKLV